MSHTNPFIPLHLVEEILLNLDPKTLIRCMSLCKDWNSLIANPDFISRHSIRTFNARKRFLFVKALHLRKSGELFRFETQYSLHLDNDRLNFLKTLKLPSINGFELGPRIVGSSNGLICLVDQYRHRNFALWNPTVKRYVLLPKFKGTSYIDHVGFGFDHIAGDYKIVILVTRDKQVDSAWVFSYLTWSWKHVTNNSPHPCYVDWHPSHVFINGVHHWIAKSIVEDCEILLTFDVSREIFGEIIPPRSIRPFTSIVAAEDTIALTRSKNMGVPIWPLWVMKQYGVDESWEILIKENQLNPIKVLDVRKNGDVILEMGGEKIMRYNPSTDQTTNIQRVTGVGVVFYYYTENLCLLDKGEHVLPVRVRKRRKQRKRRKPKSTKSTQTQ